MPDAPANAPLSRAELERAFLPLAADVRADLLEHARVRRATAMRAFNVKDEDAWKKIVACNPEMVHRLAGERYPKYRTVEIARRLLDSAPRCATRGGGTT